jgi:hypothetical protein
MSHFDIRGPQSWDLDGIDHHMESGHCDTDMMPPHFPQTEHAHTTTGRGDSLGS